MLWRGQTGEFKNGGRRLPSPFPVSRAASVDGFERAHGFRRRKSARSTGRRPRSTEPLPGVPAFRRLRRMSSRADLQRRTNIRGGEACRGNCPGFDARGFPRRPPVPPRKLPTACAPGNAAQDSLQRRACGERPCRPDRFVAPLFRRRLRKFPAPSPRSRFAQVDG